MTMKDLYDSGCPVIAVSTHDEYQFILEQGDEIEQRVGAWTISASGQLVRLGVDESEEGSSYSKAFELVASGSDRLLFCLDLHHVLRNPPIYRALKSRIGRIKGQGGVVVMLAPSWEIPPELAQEVIFFEDPLPNAQKRREFIETMIEQVNFRGATAEVTPECLDDLVDASAGLTAEAMENALGIAHYREGEAVTFVPSEVAEIKADLIRKGGLLEYYPPTNPDLLGGLGEFRSYLDQEVLPWKHDAALRVRGILLIGVPGTGKSLAAKVGGALLGWPVLRMDMGALKGSLVGQSEANMRAALRTADAVAPCVLWIDEVEKGLGGWQSSGRTDGGVTLGMVGSLLTWMQEHESPVLVAATANDFQKLPPELTRAGRFDERFFVDLPSEEEREEIAAIHLARLGCEATLASALAKITQDFTGAEIEQAAKSAARLSSRDITEEVLERAVAAVRPISKTQGDTISALRQWASSTMRIANSPSKAKMPLRKMR